MTHRSEISGVPPLQKESTDGSFQNWSGFCSQNFQEYTVRQNEIAVAENEARDEVKEKAEVRKREDKVKGNMTETETGIDLDIDNDKDEPDKAHNTIDMFLFLSECNNN